MSNLDCTVRLLARAALINVLLLATPSPATAQETRGTIKVDSLPVYRSIPQAQNTQPISTLQRDAVVRVEWSLSNSNKEWCSISSIDSGKSLGFVECSALEMKTSGRPSTSQSEPISARPHRWTQAQKEWALAASGVLTEFNHDRHDTLAGFALNAENKSRNRRTLSYWWGIKSREDLLDSLYWIENGGHRQQFAMIGEKASQLSADDSKRLIATLSAEDANSVIVARRYYEALGQKGITGWDYSRYIFLCRFGYAAGFLSEDEAWENIMSAAHHLQSTFSSWQELGENYLIGREFWSAHQTKVDGQQMRAAYRRLLTNPSSPWNRIPWELNLD